MRSCHRRAIEARGQTPAISTARRLARSVHALLGRISISGRWPPSPPLPAPRASFAASRSEPARSCSAALLRRREDGVAFAGRTRPAYARCRPSAAAALARSPRRRPTPLQLRRAAAAIIAATGRQKKCPSNQIRMTTLTALNAERPPVDRHDDTPVPHFSSGLANSSNSAITRQ